MPFCREFTLGKAVVTVWEITETAEELLLLSTVDYRSEAASMGNAKRCAEWLAVRLLLARQCGENARIVYDAAGKPSLVGCDGYISISHTRGYALLAYSKSVPIGVDVELVSRDATAAARRFLNEDFASAFHGGSKSHVLAYWCFCEALFKLVGNIGGTYKDNIAVRSFELEIQGRAVLSVVGISPVYERDYAVEYVNDGTLFIALCTEA
ncbi:MAG: hypothetical protein IKJ97_00945 [Bacteroidaceae bacterium]|nr:hypothetical protein [Bacteroidaceae bacterium]